MSSQKPFEECLAELFEAILVKVKEARPGDQSQTSSLTYEDSKSSRAPILERRFKKINEVWDKNTATYKTVDASTTSNEPDQTDGLLFIVRSRIDRILHIPTSFVDIKSKPLRSILAAILKDVRGLSLRDDNLTVEFNLLFNFYTELKTHCYGSCKHADAAATEHLTVLIDLIDAEYAPVSKRLDSLLERQEITYDLLWALFKPNSEILTICPGTQKPMGVKYNYGEHRLRPNGLEFFQLECRHFNYDGSTFGEATVTIDIDKFRGTRRIDSLDAFPIHYHPDHASMRKQLIACGRMFISMIESQHHVQYEGPAFRIDDMGQMKKIPVKSRIMIDTASFRHTNPNYKKPKMVESVWPGMVVCHSDMDRHGIRATELDPTKLNADELLICSPTVQGYSLDDKQWLEFAVANIAQISWNHASFGRLAIPPQQKKAIHAVCDAHLSQSDNPFDDFIEGKGHGLNILLHGPPGVGKTMTAEAMSEYLKRPLFTTSAGELGTVTDRLDSRLSEVFRIVSRWNAILLLDEVDVYVEQRTPSDVHRNALVCVFLRKLEYHPGILILTTNRVRTIDEAIISRIHLAFPYKALDRPSQVTIWSGFLQKAATTEGPARYGDGDLTTLSEHDLNGREIKNAVFTGRALAIREKKPVSLRFLEEAIALNKEFQRDFRGEGVFESMRSYV